MRQSQFWLTLLLFIKLLICFLSMFIQVLFLTFFLVFFTALVSHGCLKPNLKRLGVWRYRFHLLEPTIVIARHPMQMRAILTDLIGWERIQSSCFAELGRSLFKGPAQILHGLIDTRFHLFPRIFAGSTQRLYLFRNRLSFIYSLDQFHIVSFTDWTRPNRPGYA